MCCKVEGAEERFVCTWSYWLYFSTVQFQEDFSATSDNENVYSFILLDSILHITAACFSISACTTKMYVLTYTVDLSEIFNRKKPCSRVLSKECQFYL